MLHSNVPRLRVLDTYSTVTVNFSELHKLVDIYIRVPLQYVASLFVTVKRLWIVAKLYSVAISPLLGKFPLPQWA